MENTELLMQIAKLIEESEQRTAERFTRLEIIIENDISDRINALFDGYKLTHEKQWELERYMEKLERRIERLETKAG